MNKLYKEILDNDYIPKFLGILIIIGINWTFQSLLYMDKTEKLFKIVFELIIFVLLFIILQYILSIATAGVLSIIIAHTINWIINGHIFALFKTFGVIKTKNYKFNKYLNELKEKSSKESSIFLVATFGSIARKELKETSDLDIRIIRKKGIINGLRSCIFTMKERSIAFFRRLPLDIYVGDDLKFLQKVNEKAIIIYGDGESSEKLSKN